MTKLAVVAGLMLAVLATSSTQAQERRRERAAGPQGQFDVEQVAIAAGRLVITGRTAKPNQVIELVNSGDKTASLPSRRFNFSLSYLPETCKINLKVENDEIKDLLVSGCIPRSAGAPGKDGKDGKDGGDGKDGKDGRDGRDGRDGKDGNDGKDGRDGKDGSAGISYGSLPGDGTTFRCWTSDIVGLWFIKDYPAPNSRTVAHIAPDRSAGGTRLNVTEPQDPLKTEKPEGPGVTQWAEIDKDKLFLVDRETKSRAGLRGEIAPDCKSIVWKGEGEAIVRTWER